MKIPCKDCITLPICINVVKNAPKGGAMTILSSRCSIFHVYCKWGNLNTFRRKKIETYNFFKIPLVLPRGIYENSM